MTAMPKTVKRLFDLDIDEVSLVDRAANQHAVITFTKRAEPEEEQMPGFYDSDGDLVDEGYLDTGDVVFDADGNEFVYLDDETAEELVDSGELDADDVFSTEDFVSDEQYAEVGKKLVKAGKPSWLIRGQEAARQAGSKGRAGYNAGRVGWLGSLEGEGRAGRAGWRAGQHLATNRNAYVGGAVGTAGGAGVAGVAGRRREPAEKAYVPRVKAAARQAGSKLKGGYNAGRVGWLGSLEGEGRAARAGWRTGQHLATNRNAYIGGAAGTAGGGGLVLAGRSRTEKSLGAEVYEELSKALTDTDRDEVISKAMDFVAEARAEAEQANARISELEAREELAEYVSKAAEYGLPVDPEALAGLLYELDGNVSKSSAQLFNQILAQAAQAGLYDELGATGDYVDTEVMGMVSGFADQLVGKSDLTREQAVVALFETNPAAYDQYIAEQR